VHDLSHEDVLAEALARPLESGLEVWRREAEEQERRFASERAKRRLDTRPAPPVDWSGEIQRQVTGAREAAALALRAPRDLWPVLPSAVRIKINDPHRGGDTMDRVRDMGNAGNRQSTNTDPNPPFDRHNASPVSKRPKQTVA
jgi:hypothetical protein